MVNRILIRLKVVQVLYSYLITHDSDTRIDPEQIVLAKNTIATSLDKAYALYLTLLQLIRDITALQEQRLENAKAKHLPTREDLNPNTRFIDNALVGYLNVHQQFEDLCQEYKVGPEPVGSVLVKALLDKIVASDLYKQYMEAPSTSFEADIEFWREAMKQIILPSDELAEELEDKSIYWNDDFQVMGTFTLKWLRMASKSEGVAIDLLPKFKDAEDAAFGSELMLYVIRNYDTYRGYIDRFIDPQHWSADRLAFMDVVIMLTAIAEIINYPAIPVPVSVNEYVEIANNYSTTSSGSFINGILFSVVKYLNQEGIINK
ncbi:MAG: transcription antitermination protein NusB [Bacteroides sp.]|nr:transcription antitermination protein NusB [Bacteroides sp.]MCM1456355.1 transcription antitermination protein NusB [Lachnoclostridium sp.]